MNNLGFLEITEWEPWWLRQIAVMCHICSLVL